MNCAEAQHQIDRWSPEGGKAALPAELAVHLVACTPCTEYSRDRVLSALVRSVSDTRVPTGLEQRILGAVQAARSAPAPVRAGKWASRRWIFSMAASLFLALGVVLMYLEARPRGASQPFSTVSVSVDEVRDVRVMFATQKALTNARLHIGLPQHVSLAGYEGVRELSWQTDLKSGNNMITLPVHMLTPKDGLIQVTLEHEGAKKTVTISVTPENRDTGHRQKL